MKELLNRFFKCLHNKILYGEWTSCHHDFEIDGSDYKCKKCGCR